MILIQILGYPIAFIPVIIYHFICINSFVKINKYINEPVF